VGSIALAAGAETLAIPIDLLYPFMAKFVAGWLRARYSIKEIHEGER
jgi:hypothetical protein